MVSSNLSFSSESVTPMSSSSKAMGSGLSSQRRAISCHCPCFMGCSMVWICKSERIFSFSNASEGENAPFASTRSSISDGEYSSRIIFSNANSLSKSIAPIFILIHLKPAFNFSEICCFIKSRSPIQTKPLMGMLWLPSENSEGKI